MLLASVGVAEDSTIFENRQFSFPNGLSKALVLSYDDGPTQDARFIGILNKHGIKATFHINSGRLGLEAEWMTELIGDPGWYVSAEDLKSLYSGHEIGSHSVNHPHFSELDPESVRREVSRDIDTLEDLSHHKVESFAYPFGEFDDRIVAALATTRITNARTVESTGEFAVPDDFLRWHPTAHHSRALDLVEPFLERQDNSPAVFMVWGHSWEFDGNTPENNWAVAEALCKRLSGSDDVWYVGAGELIRYLQAVKNLKHIDGNWVNESGLSVWVRVADSLQELPPR